MPSRLPNSFFEVLTHEECVDVLSEEEVGRIAVVVHGTADEVSIDDWPATGLKPHEVYLEPWAPGAKLHWLRVTPRVISGRRVRRLSEAEANPFWFLSASFPTQQTSAR